MAFVWLPSCFFIEQFPEPVLVAVAVVLHESAILSPNWFSIMFNFRYSYAPWCPACRTLSPIWHNIAGWCADVNIKIGQVDITKNPGSSLIIKIMLKETQMI